MATRKFMIADVGFLKNALWPHRNIEW